MDGGGGGGGGVWGLGVASGVGGCVGGWFMGSNVESSFPVI